MITPYDVFDDGTLRSTVSNRIEDARDSALRYVKEHFVSVLHPVNEHINCLYQKIEQIEGGFAKTESCVKEFGERLDDRMRQNELLDQKFDGLQCSLEDLIRDLREGDARGRVTSLERELETVRMAVRDTDNRVDLSGASLQVLHKKLDESNASIHQIELKQWQVDAAMRQLESSFGSVEDVHRSIKDDHDALSRTLQQMQHAHDNLRQYNTKLNAQQETYQKHMNKIIGDLDNRTKGLQSWRDSSSEVIRRHETSLADVMNNIEFFNKQLGGMKEDLQNLEQAEHKTEEDMKAALAESKEDLENELRKQATLAERVREVEANLNAVRKSQEADKMVMSTVQDLNKLVKAHDSSLRQQSCLVDELRSSSTFHDERISRLEVRVGSAETTQAQLTHKHTSAQETINQLMDSAKTAETKIDDHRIEIEKMEAFSSATRHALGQTNAFVHGLQSDLGNAQTELSTTAMRLDLAHEHIRGVCGGLKETHKLSLVGQDGLLVPRSMRDKTQPLPVLETWGRPTSAPRAKPSPRVAVGF